MKKKRNIVGIIDNMVGGLRRLHGVRYRSKGAGGAKRKRKATLGGKGVTADGVAASNGRFASTKYAQSREHRTLTSKRKSPTGAMTSDATLSAMVGWNETLFPQILALHVPEGARIVDVTWGRGVFWKHVPADRYDVTGTDIQTGVDCRALPYKDESVDCVVLDPPYMEGFYRKNESALAGTKRHGYFRRHYSNSKATASTTSSPRWHAAVLDMYFRAGAEALRVLRKNGRLIVKCQDEVSARSQFLTHVEIINEYEASGLYMKDLFVLVREGKPVVANMRTQMHARKNHSYFLVFIKATSRFAPHPLLVGGNRIQKSKR